MPTTTMQWKNDKINSVCITYKCAPRKKQLSRMNAKPAENTLVTYIHRARQAKQSVYSAVVGYKLREQHFDPRGFDQTLLAITLSTVLAYLYTRSWTIAAIGFVIFFLLESIAWFLLPVFSRAIKMHVSAVEARDYEPIVDWLVFVYALLFAIGAVELSILNLGAGSIAPFGFPATTSDWASAIAVVFVSMLSAFPNIYFLSGILLQATIWIVYLVVQTDFALWIAVRASASAIYFFIWFRHPIAFHFGFNAAISLTAATFIISIISGIAIV